MTRRPKSAGKPEDLAKPATPGAAPDAIGGAISGSREAIDRLELLRNLEQTEVFKEIPGMIERNDFMDELRRLRPDIDWDDFIYQNRMKPYTIDLIMGFLERKRIDIPRPSPRSITMAEILADPKMLEFTINRLEWDHDHVDPRHFGAFVLAAAERQPQVVFNYFSTRPYAEVRDPDYRNAIVRLLSEKGLAATEAMLQPPPPGQEPAIVW